MITKAVPISRRKLSDEVGDRLLALVHEGGLNPGDVLPSERELMAAYKVGRPAIREAMQNLQRNGLIEIRHGERPRIAEPSMDAIVDQMAQSMRHLLTHSESSLQHLKEARLRFETEMARVAAHKRTDADIDRLKNVLGQQKRLRNNSRQFLEADGAFHQTVAAISGNPIYELLSVSLFNWLAHFHKDLVRKPGLEKLTLDEHKMILNAIAAGDPDAAGNHMADHLNRANVLYHQKFSRVSGV